MGITQQTVCVAPQKITQLNYGGNLVLVFPIPAMDSYRIDEYVYAFRLAIPRTSHCSLAYPSESVLQIIEFQIIFVEIEKVSSSIVNKSNGNSIIQGRLQVQMSVEDKRNSSFRNGSDAFQRK